MSNRNQFSVLARNSRNVAQQSEAWVSWSRMRSRAVVVTSVTVTTEAWLNVLGRNTRNMAQQSRASHISVILVKNAKPGIVVTLKAEQQKRGPAIWS